ncbi:phosphate ABC transporter permease PstA [Paractinoplanes globisporus]|uniref:Phosphate transport system permease protein PstA n=1 Tax=Paractinoplanes globisporus TaxID=113565 RepID=A0ABW6WRT4_9ACTN|nr:phosphate ABC transporter permease PstA [Actinoplanes globisporus]
MTTAPQRDATTAPPPHGATTTVPHLVPGAQPESLEPEERRVTAGVSADDVTLTLGAIFAGVSATALIYFWLAPFSGLLGFVVCSFVMFLAFFAVLVWLDGDGPAVRDRLVGAIVHGLAFLLLLALGFVVFFTLFRGWKALVHLNFFTQDLTRAGPLEPLTVGGALHAVVGTLEQIALALIITVPLGLVCALFLSELRGGFTRFVRTVVEAMTALPSIVAGLFIYATVLLILGFEKSGFAASLAISVMMLPIMIRAADVVLRLVPGNLKEASLALGASRWRTVRTVVLPTARPGLATAIILATARGVGETSPVLLTAGYSAALNANPFKGPQVSLPLATFTLIKSPQPNVVARGFGTAALLLALVLMLFIVARLIGGRGPQDLSPRQQRARARASARDAARFSRRHPPQPILPGISLFPPPHYGPPVYYGPAFPVDSTMPAPAPVAHPTMPDPTSPVERVTPASAAPEQRSTPAPIPPVESTDDPASVTGGSTTRNEEE